MEAEVTVATTKIRSAMKPICVKIANERIYQKDANCPELEVNKAKHNFGWKSVFVE